MLIASTGNSGVVFAVKLYPAGATTNSQDGVTDLFGKCLPVLEEMVEQNMPLLAACELLAYNKLPQLLPLSPWGGYKSRGDVFDREKVFIDTVLRPLIQKFPRLKVVMEHITTMDAVRYSRFISLQLCLLGSVAATVTPQHLVLNRNSLFQGGLQPHNYCLPVLKRETHSKYCPHFLTKQIEASETGRAYAIENRKSPLERMKLVHFKESLPEKRRVCRATMKNLWFIWKISCEGSGCDDGQAIVSAVTSGSRKFFLGTDSAPHERRRKECPCGCAGIYNAPVALSLYAKVFEEAGALDKLEAFTSFNGPDFYGLPRNTSKIKLSKTPWKVPESYSFSFGDIVPMFAGETLDWLPSSP
ncbi:Dihydroorotase, mitochondrial [Vitis vinifera]|uniref:Dihydroorotase, mitochondrial n=1 Tax=Vitis vinifera TaxID=29760 RepID=A0A438JKC1_VITVI|nr:Dihydroorotase, mitochondrial [Vitis vinifera]